MAASSGFQSSPGHATVGDATCIAVMWLLQDATRSSGTQTLEDINLFDWSG